MIMLKISVSVSLFIIVVMLVRRIMLYRLPKRTFLILWSVASLRLMNAFSISSKFSIYTLFDRLKRKDFRPGRASSCMIFNRNLADLKDISATVLYYEVIIREIWLVGLAICALLILTRHFCGLREYRESLPVDNEYVRVWERKNRMMRKVEIRQSDKINSALTYGLFRPVVLLPKITDWEDERKINYILTHEYVHIRKFDIVYKWLFAAVVCIHWFNPFVWIMYLLANRDIELACDETVVQKLGLNARASYAFMHVC